MYKKITVFTFVFFIFQFNSSLAIMQKKLIIHMDVNKTIIALDLAQGKDVEETVNIILTEFTRFAWDSQDEQSYYTFLTDQVAQEFGQLNRASEEFKKIRDARLRTFPSFLKKYPHLLATYEQEKNDLLHMINRHEMGIFPSFYKLISWLDAHYPNNYTIHLRTFGIDLNNLIAAIEKNSTLKFAGRGTFKNGTLSLAIEKKSLSHFFSNTGAQHFAISDDYPYWKASGFQTHGGKPFPIDAQNAELISIFFDDNADDAERPIICPLQPDGTIADTQELMQKGIIVSVNSKQAILDEDYFINKIKAVYKS